MNIYNKPLKFINLDDIHWKGNKLLSLGKDINIAISGRIPGKTTFFNIMLYRQWYEKNRRFVMLTRLQVDVSDSMIDDIAKTINKFLPADSRIKLVFSKGNLKNGICDVYCYPEDSTATLFSTDEDHLFFRVIALSTPIDRIKKAHMVPNCEWFFFDEFTVSKKLGGKYLPYEAEIFDQVYNTYYRESKHLRCIFCGNPYSKYNPYTAWFKMNLKDIKIGNIYTGDKWAIEYIKISPELRQWVIDHNGLLDLISEEEQMFNLEGESIEDDNIVIVENEPKNMRLAYLFKLNGKILGVYKFDMSAKIDFEIDPWYWIKMMPNDYNTTRRHIACFNAYDLCTGVKMHNRKESTRFDNLCRAYRNYAIAYNSLEAASYFEEIYEYIS